MSSIIPVAPTPHPPSPLPVRTGTGIDGALSPPRSSRGGAGGGALRTANARILRTKLRRRGDDRVGGDVEMLVDIGPRGARAETRHANEGAGGSDITVPPKPRGGFDADARRGAEHLRAIVLALPLKQLPAGHRDDGDALAVLAQGFCCRHRERDFRSG